VPAYGTLGNPRRAESAKPLRSSANLRPPSRSACVIDRLFKNQNPLENRNNLRSSRHTLVLQRVLGTAPQFCGPKFITREPWLFRSLVFGRAFDDSTARRSAAAASRGPAQTRHALAGGFDNRTTWLQRSLQPGMTPVPITLFYRKVAARLFRRCPQPVISRIMPDSLFASTGSAFTETAKPPTTDRDGDRKLARLQGGLPQLVIRTHTALQCLVGGVSQCGQ
jgi:hypothetical protein